MLLGSHLEKLKILDSGSDVSILLEAWSSIGTQGKIPRSLSKWQTYACAW